MKKFTIALSVLWAILAVTTVNASPVPNNEETAVCLNNDGDWKKVDNQTWPGMKDGKTYWYKLDKNAKLWWSMDGKEWAEVKDGMWADKDGKWLKIHNKKLVWSADMGETWGEVPEWKWEASDGMWYKFDKNWTLWMNK